MWFNPFSSLFLSINLCWLCFWVFIVYCFVLLKMTILIFMIIENSFLLVYFVDYWSWVWIEWLYNSIFIQLWFWKVGIIWIEWWWVRWNVVDDFTRGIFVHHFQMEKYLCFRVVFRTGTKKFFIWPFIRQRKNVYEFWMF